MTLVPISLEHLTVARQAIEGIANFTVSVHDGEGRLLLASQIEDPVLLLVTNSETGREEYSRFMIDTIKNAVIRKEITIEKAPSGHYHFFIPYHLNDTSLVFVGGSFYLSLSDFQEFISKSTYKYKLSLPQLEALSEKITIKDYEQIRTIAQYIQKLFSSSVKNGYESNIYKERYSRTKTILRLLSEIEEDISSNEIYALFSDMLIFLFNVDSISILADDGELLKLVHTAGRLKETVDKFNVEKSVWIISETIRKGCPVFCNDPVDMRSLGIKGQMKSIYLFPSFSKSSEFQLLCIFNTELNKEEEEEISGLFQHIHLLTNAVFGKDNYSSRMKEMTMLNLATSGLNLMFNKPEVLYSSIVDTAVKLSKAEKGSLLLADEGREELSVKAVYGESRWLFKDLKIRPGEGIAGKVFKESVPVVSKDIEKDFSIKSRPKYKTPSFMSIPLKIGDETIGVLNVTDKISGEVFHEEDLALIHYFANYASIALKGSTYYNLAEHMKELSITDPLTNLYNRRYFQDRLTEEIDRSERHKLNFSLCIIDIDDFKLYNDSEGHPAGDDLLKKLTRLIHESLRAIDVLARIGGEEFAVIMPQTDKDEAFFVAERIRNELKHKLDSTWKFYPKVNITVSIGISTFPFDGSEAKKLIWNADKALYRAKMHGKDKTVPWEERNVT